MFEDSARVRAFTRNYNPKRIPVYIANHLDRVNARIPDSVEYVVLNAAVMSYRGATLIMDSPSITVRTSKGYGMPVAVED